jgi:V-type H+-transporting ATPase subunit D
VSIVYANHSEDINSELDELDREEFYRLKKVSGKKQRDVAAADAEILAARQKAAAEQAEQAEAPKVPSATAALVQEEEPADVLGEQEDNDVIF